jgi:hypothetical protein
MLKPFKLSRRAVLRGTGVAIALPTLEAMLTDRGLFHGSAQAQPSAPPVRIVTFFLPNGFPQGNRFVPSSTGAGYALTPCLQPIKEHVADFTVLSGGGPPSGGVGETHASGIAGFATGLGSTRTGGTGPSIDYIAGKRRGQGTRFPSLSIGPQREPMPNTNGFSYDIYRNTAWQGPNQVIPLETDPNAVFQKLFGAGVPQQTAPNLEQMRRDRKSVLDHVTGRIERLERKLGAEDRLRLEAHLTGIRELERRLPLETQAPASTCSVPKKEAPTGFFSKALLMADLLATALQCNLTYYASFMHSIGAGDGGRDASLGLTVHHHQITHAGNQETMQKFTVAQMRVFARFLDRLKAANEGGGQSVLYNSVVLLGTELGNGTNHNPNNLPYVLAGHAGGRLKTAGKHIRLSSLPRSGRLLLTLLRLAGINEPSFANQTNPLSELMG